MKSVTHLFQFGANPKGAATLVNRDAREVT
jgi:hypothetical protein